MQGTVRKGDPDKALTHVRNINQMVDDMLLKLKIDPTPKPDASAGSDADKAVRFRRFVQERITTLEAETGKKLTPEQQQKIIDGLAIDIAYGKGFFGGTLAKPRYDLTIKDVPDTEKVQIVDALKRAGRPVTDAMIIELFARKNAKPR